MKSVLFIVLDYDFYRNKFNGQMNSMIKLGYSTYCYTYDKNTESYLFFHHTQQNNETINNWQGSWNSKRFVEYIDLLCIDNSFEIIYIRRLGKSMLYLTNLLKKSKANGIKCYYEIPTYPFEDRGLKGNIKQFFEKNVLRYFISPYVEAIPVYVCDSNSKLLRKMLPVENCAAVEKYYEYFDSLELPDYDGTALNLVGVAHYQRWHAFDRIIDSIADYRSNHSININFVVFGNINTETERLIEYVKDSNYDFVSFLEENDVNDYYRFMSQFHIAVGCLGIHRKNINSNSTSLLDTSIKNKEYCAMGIPFLHSTKDASFSSNLPFHYMLPSNEEPINFSSVISWYDAYRKRFSDRKEMINYAMNNLSFDKWASKVFRLD